MADPRIERLTEMVAALRQEGYNRQESIELLYARIEALEAAQQQVQLDQSLAPPIGVKPQWLADEERLGDLEAAIKRYKDSGLPVPLDWVIEVCEIRDRQKERRTDLGLRGKVNLIVQVQEDGKQPDHIADASKMVAPPAPAGVQRRYPSPATIAECGGPCDSQGPEACDCGLLQELNPPSPAPAGGLVELIRDELGHHGTASASAVIRRVATWLRSKLISRAVADLLEQEANR